MPLLNLYMKAILRYVKAIFTADYLAYLPKDVDFAGLLAEVAQIMTW